MNPSASAAGSGIRWPAVVAGAAAAWTLAWVCKWLLPVVMSLNVIGAPREGYYRFMTFAAAIVGGAIAGRVAMHKAALHGTLALAMQVALAFIVALSMKAARGHFSLASFGGPYVVHAAWMVLLGYVGGLLVATRIGERVAHTGTFDRPAVILGAAVAVGILIGFGVGSGIMWNVGRIIIGPVLLFGGAISGALAVRRGAIHGTLAGVLTSVTILLLTTYSLASGLPRMLEMPGYWLKALASCIVAIIAAAIGGLLAAWMMSRSRA